VNESVVYDTCPEVADGIKSFLLRDGVNKAMLCLALGNINNNSMARFLSGKKQDQCVMEGMVCKEIRAIQHTHSSITGLQCNTERWGRELVTHLLEVMHGQWLYRNVQVHDRITGTLATQKKEELQMEIECQQELGMEGLLDDDCYLAECNLGDLEDTTGIRETYWLLAIQAAREASSRQEGMRTQPVTTVQNNI
jgi:hypothetical protein